MKLTVVEGRPAAQTAGCRHFSVNFTLLPADRHSGVVRVKPGTQHVQRCSATKTAWITEARE